MRPEAMTPLASTEPAVAVLPKSEMAEGTHPTASSHTEEYTLVHTAPRKYSKKIVSLDDDEPLIDTTATLPLHSKKTKRLEKLKLKRQRKINVESVTSSFLQLPAELLSEILGYLRPSDICSVLLVSRATRDFVYQNENSIARDMVQRRYWVLSRCFPLPVPLHDVDEEARSALLNPRREKVTEIHMKPYQHIRPMDVQKICSCHSCLFAWNNLCIVLDLAHFQDYLNTREPIPMIPRGTNSEWNMVLTGRNAMIVEHALSSLLCYAAILEKHLNSIVGTLLRSVRFPPPAPKHRHMMGAAKPAKTVHPNRLYHLMESDAATGTDEFLERQGDPSYQMPFHRDNYYNRNMDAYVPNRKWSKEEKGWMYYAAGGHERDLALAKRWFAPKPPSPPEADHEAFIASFRATTTT